MEGELDKKELKEGWGKKRDEWDKKKSIKG